METMRAKILKVEQDFGSDWFRIQTDHSSIKRLDTKRRELAVLAEQIRRELVEAEIDYNSRPGKNINPRTGQPFVNYYFEGARPVAAAPEVEIPVAGAPVRKTDPGDAWRMCLNKGGELAVMTLELMPENQRDFETQKQIAIAWATFFMFTPTPTGFGNEPAGNGSQFHVPASVGSPGAYSDPSDEPPPRGDDDIPF